MASIAALRVALSTSRNICHCHSIVVVPRASYAVKKVSKAKGKGGAAAVQPKKHYDDIETDPVKLTTMLCGGNIMKEGADPVLKEDHEYPDWLWELRTDKEPVPLDQLDPDSKVYWKAVRKMDMKKTRLHQKTQFRWKNF